MLADAPHPPLPSHPPTPQAAPPPAAPPPPPPPAALLASRATLPAGTPFEFNFLAWTGSVSCACSAAGVWGSTAHGLFYGRILPMHCSRVGFCKVTGVGRQAGLPLEQLIWAWHRCVPFTGHLAFILRLDHQSLSPACPPAPLHGQQQPTVPGASSSRADMGHAGVGAGIKAEPAPGQLPPAPPSVPAMVLSPTLSLGSATASPALPALPARGSGVGARSALPLPPHLMRCAPHVPFRAWVGGAGCSES